MKKRMLKQILGIILCMVVVFTSIPQMPEVVHAETAGVATVTDEAGFMTALADPNVSVIQLGGDIQFAQSSDGNDNVLVIPRSVTITGGSMSLWRAGIILGGNVTFENVSINFNTSVRNAIIANGYALTLNNVSANGTFNVDVFCGGISDYTGGNAAELPASGGAANVTITNTNLSGKGGNIYAGNLSDVGNGAADVATTYGGSATINIGANTSIGQIYAHGARENRTGGYANEWIPSATLYPVTGNVTVNLNTVSPITVDGTTGGAQNAAFTYTDNGTGNLCEPNLSNVSSITLSGTGANLAPYITGTVTSVSVPSSTKLNLKNTSGVLTTQTFAGGGVVVFPENMDTSKLTITGSVSGNTQIASGGVGADGVSSTNVFLIGHNYVSYSGVENETYNFSLLPYTSGANCEIECDATGNWVTKYTENAIVISSIEIDDFTQNAGVFEVNKIPIRVTYASQNTDDYVAQIPVVISVNDWDSASENRSDNGDYYYTTGNASTNISLGFDGYYEEADGTKEEWFWVQSDGDNMIPLGEYEINITIPAQYMANGSAYTTSFTLAVICEHGTMQETDGTCPDCGSMLAVASVTVDGVTTYYATNEAFQAVDIYNTYKTQDIIVNLYQDVTYTYENAPYNYITGNWIINLNGHTMYVTNEYNDISFAVGENATFTVNGPGKIEGEEKSFFINRGKLVIGGSSAPDMSQISLKDATVCLVQINVPLQTAQYEVLVQNPMTIGTPTVFIIAGNNINLLTDWFVYDNYRDEYCGELALNGEGIYFNAVEKSHAWNNGVCSNCHYECNHYNDDALPEYTDGVCNICGLKCSHDEWNIDGQCIECWIECLHNEGSVQDCGGHRCNICRKYLDTNGTGEHTDLEDDGICDVCESIIYKELKVGDTITETKVKQRWYQFTPRVSGEYVFSGKTEQESLEISIYNADAPEFSLERLSIKNQSGECRFESGNTYYIESICDDYPYTFTISCKEHKCIVISDDSTVTAECEECGKIFSVDVEKEASRVCKSNETVSIRYDLNGNTFKSISYYDEENNNEEVLTKDVDYTIDTENSQIILKDSWLDTFEAGTYRININIELAEKSNVGLCPSVSITIEEACAKIDDVHYGTLEEAIAAASSNTDADNQPVITLLVNIYLENTVEIRQGVFTIDLNGKTISSSENENFSLFSLEYIDNDELKVVTIVDSSNNKTGKMDASNIPSAIWVYEGKLIVDGGTFVGKDNAIIADMDGNITINDGTFESDYYAIDFESTGTATINNGTYKGITLALRASKGTVIVNDGTFESTSHWAIGLSNNANVEIKGGNFASEEESICYFSDASLHISGGTFNEKLSIYTVEAALPELKDILADDCYYYDANGNILKPAYDATSIDGTVTVQKGADLSDADITLSSSVYTYTGQEFTPTLVVTMCGNTLEEGVDYTITNPENRVDAGIKEITITAKGSIYTGSKTVEYNITPANVSDAEVTVASGNYTGNPLTPEPTVIWNNSTLTKDTDYTLSYSNNTLAGTAVVTITGKGNFAGTKEVNFTITDTTAPTICMDIEGNIFTDILDVITLGHFYKDGVDVNVTADGTGSAIAKVEYMISTDSYANASLPTAGWTTVEKDAEGTYTFTVAAKNKGSVYVKVTDAGGNMAVVNSEGVVVYTDSVLTTTEVVYTKTTKADASISLNLNENTVANVSKGDILLTDEEYKVEGEKVVFSGNYLDTLELGHNTITITVNPMGETYVESAENDAPVALTVALVVNRAEGSVSIASDLTKVYDGNKVATPEYATESTGAVTIEYKDKSASDDTYTTNAPVNAGTYVVRVSVAEDDNYTPSSATKEFTIKQATLTVAGATAQTKEYDGTKAVAITEVMLNGIKGTDMVSIDIPKLTATVSSANAGEYTEVALSALALAGEDKDNYILSASTQTVALGTAVEITKKPITVTAQDKSKKFGENDPELTYTVSGLVSGETLTGALSREEGEDAGEYDITAGTLTNENNSNYAITFEKGVLAIEKVAVVVRTAPESKSLTYNGENQPLVTAGTTDDGTMMYSLSENGTYSAEIPTATEAGDYTVWYYVKGDGNHTDSEKVSVKTVINKASLIVSGVDASSRDFDGKKEVVITGITLDGIFENDVVGVSFDKLSGALYSANAGTYTTVTLGDLETVVTLTGTDKDNYVFKFTDGTEVPTNVTIYKVAAVVNAAPTANKLTFNGNAQMLVKTGTTNDGIMMYSLSENGTYSAEIPTATEAGDYTVWYYVAGVGNYTDSAKASVKVTIKEAPHIQNEEGKMGWDVIRDEVKDAKPGDTVSVDMNGSTEIAGDVIEDIKGKDITISFDMGNGITWSVNGKSVTENNIADIDLAVTVGTEANPIKNIPMKIINEVTGDNYHMEISLAHNGEFGFEAVLSMNLKAENAGLFANLYYFNPQRGELEFISEDEIAEDGTAELTFTHASDYTIVIKEKETANNILPYFGFITSPKTGETVNYIFVVMLIAACVYWVNKKKCVR